MFPFRMENTENNDLIIFDAVEKFIGKPAREQPAKVTVIQRAAFRVDLKRSHGMTDLVQQFNAQARAL